MIRIRLEPRSEVPLMLRVLTPVAALVLTCLVSMALFLALGYPPLQAMYVYFIAPITTVYGLAEWCIKAMPLLLCALGLMFCFRAGVWNIGAEGQLIVGALTGGAMALWLPEDVGGWGLLMVVIAGIAGGALWASIPAFLKTRFGANEILASLMLTYVATLLLSVMVHGSLRDPLGFNFPQSRPMQDGVLLPLILTGTRLNISIFVGIAAVAVALLIHKRHEVGFGIRLLGLAPRAAVYAGFKKKRLVWVVLLASGGLAGLAGAFEIVGPIGRLLPTVSPGYGFTAIIVAFLGQLHPIGVLLASFVIALSYLGGELAQVLLKIPNAVTGVFQGILLFMLLGCDLMARYRIWIVRSHHESAKEVG